MFHSLLTSPHFPSLLIPSVTVVNDRERSERGVREMWMGEKSVGTLSTFIALRAPRGGEASGWRSESWDSRPS